MNTILQNGHTLNLSIFDIGFRCFWFSNLYYPPYLEGQFTRGPKDIDLDFMWRLICVIVVVKSMEVRTHRT